MIVFCEECGGKYRVDPSKIKGDAAQGKCQFCGHVITIMKPDVRSSESQHGYNAIEKATPHFKPTIQKKHAGNHVAKIFGKRSWRIGLTAKFMFFILVPLVIIMGQKVGIDPRALALLVAVCASNSFVLPTHQVNALLMSPGGYHNVDYIKAGGIMTILFIVIAVALIYLIFT